MGNRHKPNSGHADLLSTTETSLAILDAIRANDGARPSQLTEELDLAKSTVHTHLKTLQNARYVTKEGSQYHLGLKFFEFGEYVISRKAAYDIAERHTNALTDRIDYVADFSVEEHGRVISLYSDLYNSQQAFFGDRRTFYMHNTAAGKAILAEVDQAKVHRIVEQWGLPNETEKGLSTPEALVTELEQIQERGYAINDEETIRGLYSIGIAILYPNNDVCGAISIDIPKYRVNDKLVTELVEELQKTVADFEEDLETEQVM
ncbi:IclR family transcriptional regulator [Halorussus salinisoli]|uniref:IclR family transcriptional regulator n=1 Tax=Halorussus salinisoli TaxID=2558242 RepID=UPI0010C18335|nr:IclR family transcriptional regulator [Halorussus salinisoli]